MDDTLRERLDVSGFTVNGQGRGGCRPGRPTGTGGATGGAHVVMVDAEQGGQCKLFPIFLRCGMARHTSSWTGIVWPCARSSCCTGVDAGDETSRHHHAPRSGGQTDSAATRYLATSSDLLNPGATGRQKRPSTSWRNPKYIMGKTAGKWSRTWMRAMLRGRCRGLMGKGAPLGIPRLSGKSRRAAR